jgi:hypothetical protein
LIKGQSKEKAAPVFTQAPHREDIWGTGGYLHAVLNSALRGDEWSAERKKRISDPTERNELQQ